MHLGQIGSPGGIHFSSYCRQLRRPDSSGHRRVQYSQENREFERRPSLPEKIRSRENTGSQLPRKQQPTATDARTANYTAKCVIKREEGVHKVRTGRELHTEASEAGNPKFAKVLRVYERAPATACWAAGEIFLPSLLKRTRTGGARLRRPSRERTRTTWAWIAHEMQ